MAFLRCASSSAWSMARPLILLVLQDDGAFVLARLRDHRLGAREERRHHHLVAQHEVVDDGVMAVELPAPRLFGGRLAHDGDVVLPFAQELEVVVSARRAFR